MVACRRFLSGNRLRGDAADPSRSAHYAGARLYLLMAKLAIRAKRDRIVEGPRPISHPARFTLVRLRLPEPSGDQPAL
jgi:hypothetical protein